MRWMLMKMVEKLREAVCAVMGHRLRWFHEQQKGCECARCKWIIDRDGVTVVHGPM
jgi:hypothetical protein